MMLMSRREQPTWRETVRNCLWPQRGWQRTIRYARLRLQRLRVVPRSLALGAGAGVFVAVLPIPGLQLLAAAGLAWLIRGHRGTAALATFAANPITYPLIWLSSYALGATILGTPLSNATHDLDLLSGLIAQDWTLSPSATDGLRSLLPALTILAVGALPLAALSALVAYASVRHALRRRDAPVAVPALRLPTRRPRQSAALAISSRRDWPPTKAAA